MSTRYCRIFMGIFLLLVTACVPDKNSQTLRFAYQNRIGCAIPIIAVEKSFFKEEGLAIKALRFSSGPECAEALYTGSADIGTMGDAAAVMALARNSHFIILTSHCDGEHRHRIMVSEDSDIRTPEDLEGKKLGVKKGTSTYGGLLKLLRKENIDLSAIAISDLSPPAMTEALLSGSIDAFAASEPTPSAAEEKGCRELMTLGNLGNSYPLFILSRKEYIESNNDKLQKFFRALEKAERFIAENPEESSAIVAQVTGLSKKTCMKSMQIHRYTIGIDSIRINSLEETASKQ